MTRRSSTSNSRCATVIDVAARTVKPTCTGFACQRLTMAAALMAGGVLWILAGSANAQTQNTTTSFQYDVYGNLTQVTDPLGHVTKFGYDALNRRTTITDAALGVTRNTYDGLDQLTGVTDPRNVATGYTVDGLGNLVQTVSADTGTTSNTYDVAGSVKTRIDAKGQTTGFQYDGLNRVTSISYADGSSVTYQYDQGTNGIGRLTQITDAGGSIAYSYDQHGRLLNETRTIGGIAYTTAYRYDSAGRLAGMTYPNGRSIDYVRDAMGRISQITSTKDSIIQPLVTSVLYQPFGPPQAVTFANGQVYQRTFDLDGRIASFTQGAQVQAITYDAASRITGIVDPTSPASGNSYGYDLLDRLTSYITPAVGLGYSYDAVGNRTQKTTNGVVTGYSYGATSNRLTQAGPQTITTDGNGSITNNSRAQFAYDARGRMMTAVSGGVQVQYRINALGQRVQKITPTDSTVFHYDLAGKLISETTTIGNVVTNIDYVYLGDLPVAVLK
jgi:YD repeat-containing protein